MDPKPQRVKKPKKPKNQQNVNINVKVDKEKKKPQKVNRVTVVHDTKTGERALSSRILRRELRRIKKRERKLEGPKTDNVMLTTMTIGTVDGTTTQKGLLRKHKVLLNPLLLKPADSEAVATPITTRASQYSLFKINHLSVRILPLVGKAVVAGSIAIFDIQQTGAVATPDNLDDIKARTHSEVPLGVSRIWRVPPKDLVGPRDGWWYVDTNDDPTQSLGPALNVWLYGKTSNLFSQKVEEPDNFYPGPLFLVEIKAQYAFANYSPKPGLATMVKGGWKPKKGDIKLTTDETGNLQLVVSNAPSFFLRAEARAGSGTLGEILWAVAGAAVDGVSTAFPQWGWLIRSGWFVVRRLFGKQNYDLTATYRVYASAEDAAKDFPVRMTSGYYAEMGIVGDLAVTQLNNPNLNEKTTEVPILRFQPGVTHDYVPTGVSGAPILENPLPLMYRYSPTDGYKKFDPQWDGTGGSRMDLNGAIAISGHPLIVAKTFDNEKTLSISYWRYNDKGRTETITLKSSHFILFDFGLTAFTIGLSKTQGGTEFKEFGVMHTGATLTQSILELRDKTEQDGLYKLLDGDGSTGNFNVLDRLFGASWNCLLREFDGDILDEPLFSSFLTKGWSSKYVTEVGHGNLEYALAVPTAYLSNQKPWQGKQQTGTVQQDSIVLFSEGRTIAIAATTKDPNTWNYQGPQWFTPCYDKQGKLPFPGWYEVKEDGAYQLSDSEIDTDSEIEVITRKKYRSGKNEKQN